ncbi:hypothetical protein PAMA_003179 [Pampus argenteus]
MSKYVYPQQERAVHLFSILSDLPPSLFLSLSLFGEEEDRREEWSSLSLRPECLAVFKWRTRTCFCLPMQIHCGGRWASTHIHTSSLRTQTCVSFALSLCRLATKSSATESVGAEHRYGNQHSGPGCSWIICETFLASTVPELIIEFLHLNVLPRLAK